MIHKHKNVFTRQKKGVGVHGNRVRSTTSPAKKKERERVFERRLGRSVLHSRARWCRSSSVAIAPFYRFLCLQLKLKPGQSLGHLPRFVWIRFCASFNSVSSPLFRHINQRRLPGLVCVGEVFFWVSGGRKEWPLVARENELVSKSPAEDDEMDLDQWLEKVKGGNHLLEDELKQLCEYVSPGVEIGVCFAFGALR